MRAPGGAGVGPPTPGPLADPITIVGGGIGGLAVANALQRMGLDFALYERAPALTEVGAGIGLSAGALRVLDALGLGDAARAAGVEIASVCFADRHLNVRRKLPMTSRGRCIHRAALIDVLRAPLPPGKPHLRRTAVGVVPRADHAEVLFDDGERVAAPCVIAADGIHSALRRTVFPDVRVRPIGQTIWRGITDGEPPALLRDGYVEIWDEGLRFLTVPLAAPPGTARTFWLAVKPAPPGGVDDPATVKDEIAALFAGYHPALLSLVRDAAGPILRDDMADLGPPRAGWHHGRVVFLGDAIHATTPNLAQGGCQALEDALCLALCLDTAGGDYERAFATYHRLRRAKVGYVVRTSWSFGKAAHAANSLVHYGYRALLEHAPAWFLERQERYLNDVSYLEAVDRRGLLAA